MDDMLMITYRELKHLRWMIDQNGQIHQADVSEFVHQQGVIYTDMYIYTYTKIVYI